MTSFTYRVARLRQYRQAEGRRGHDFEPQQNFCLNLSLAPKFVDTALSQEIQSHFAAVFKNEGNAPLTRARVARQFGWQILIQPAFDYSDQYAIQTSTACDPSYLRFPTYINSAHPVTVYQPAELFADMSAFLAQTLPVWP